MRNCIDTRNGSAQDRASCQAERPFSLSAESSSAGIGFGRHAYALAGIATVCPLTSVTHSSLFMNEVRGF